MWWDWAASAHSLLPPRPAFCPTILPLAFVSPRGLSFISSSIKTEVAFHKQIAPLLGLQEAAQLPQCQQQNPDPVPTLSMAPGAQVSQLTR